MPNGDTPSAGSATSGTPVAPVAAGDHKIYAVAGGNHVTIELDRGVSPAGCWT